MASSIIASVSTIPRLAAPIHSRCSFLVTILYLASLRSSGSMPRAVREALISVLAGEDEAGQNPEGVEESKAEADMGLGGSNRERAEQMLRDMEKNGRYLQETW